MKEFFYKHAHSFEPADAIDLLYHKVGNIKELVLKGDTGHLNELKELSNMIDDYVRYAQGYSFKPREYKEYPHHKSSHDKYEKEMRYPYRSEGAIGFNPYHPLPYYDKSGEYDDRRGK